MEEVVFTQSTKAVISMKRQLHTGIQNQVRVLYFVAKMSRFSMADLREIRLDRAFSSSQNQHNTLIQ